MFDNHTILTNKQIVRILSLRDLRFVLCSRDLDLLCAQRIIGFFHYPQINEVEKSDQMDNMAAIRIR